MKLKLLFLSISTLLAIPQANASPSLDMTSKVTSQVSKTVSDNVAREAFANMIIPELKVRNSSGVIKQMQLSSDKHFLSLLLEDGTTRVWDLDLGIQRPTIAGNQTNRIAVDGKRDIVFTSNAGAGIESYEVLTGQRLATLPSSAKTVNDLEVSADGSALLMSSGNQQLASSEKLQLAANNSYADASPAMTGAEKPALSSWDTRTHKLKWQQSDFNGTLGNISLTANNRYAAVVCHTSSGADVLEIRDFNSGKKIQTFPYKGEKIIFSQFNSDKTIEVGYSNGEIVSWNLQTGAASQSKNLTMPIIAMDKAENVYAYVLDNGSVLATDAQGNKLATLVKENNPVKAVALLAKGKKLITTMENGQIFLWNLADGKELLQLISTKQGWTVVDSVGRFDSSEQGMPNVSWQAGEEEIPFDNIATEYYEPGLLASALNDDNYLVSKPNAIQRGITLPPKLEVSVNNSEKTNEEVELTVDVYDQGGGIEDVNLYHNEKAVNVQRAIVSDQTIKEKDKLRRTITLKIKPTPGKNQVKAVASNKIGIENQSNEALFNADISTKPPLLKVASIGINQYSDKRLNLDYSVADAQSIEDLLTKNGLARFATAEKKQLYNRSASKMAILSTLRELSQGNQGDVLAIYFAGHGISVNGEWYFLPYETSLRSDLKYFASVGVSATEISEIFKDSSIQNILLMIDSCYSGASLDSFKNLQNSQRKFSRTISKSVGITIVTATRKNQQAAELSDLGHGLFTYVLGKGINGEADFMPQDKKISAHELAMFSTRTIPNFSKRYMDSAQEPTAFTMGQDFVLFNRK